MSSVVVVVSAVYTIADGISSVVFHAPDVVDIQMLSFSDFIVSAVDTFADSISSGVYVVHVLDVVEIPVLSSAAYTTFDIDQDNILYTCSSKAEAMLIHRLRC